MKGVRYQPLYATTFKRLASKFWVDSKKPVVIVSDLIISLNDDSSVHSDVIFILRAVHDDFRPKKFYHCEPLLLFTNDIISCFLFYVNVFR